MKEIKPGSFVKLRSTQNINPCHHLYPGRNYKVLAVTDDFLFLLNSIKQKSGGWFKNRFISVNFWNDI